MIYSVYDQFTEMDIYCLFQGHWKSFCLFLALLLKYIKLHVLIDRVIDIGFVWIVAEIFIWKVKWTHL